MPRMFRYCCSACSLELPVGWGGRNYVTSDSGKRMICPHPGENRAIADALHASEDELEEARRNTSSMWWSGKRRARWKELVMLISARTGFLSDCLCCDCGRQFQVDLEKDRNECPDCLSDNVSSVTDLFDKQCPICGAGTISEPDTGIKVWT